MKNLKWVNKMLTMATSVMSHAFSPKKSILNSTALSDNNIIYFDSESILTSSILGFIEKDIKLKRNKTDARLDNEDSAEI